MSGTPGRSGGTRVGAGRKVGSKTLIHKRALKLLEFGGKRTPLEVMLSHMWRLEDEGDFKGACALAREAAPYCHSKLQSIDNLHEHEPVQITIAKFGDAGGAVNIGISQSAPLVTDEFDDDEEEDEADDEAE